MPLGSAPAAFVIVTSAFAVTSSGLRLAGLTEGVRVPIAVNPVGTANGTVGPCSAWPGCGTGGAKTPVSATTTANAPAPESENCRLVLPPFVPTTSQSNVLSFHWTNAAVSVGAMRPQGVTLIVAGTVGLALRL